MDSRCYDIVFVVLVYRNCADLTSFFSSLCLKNCKVVVVNSYYDDATETEFKRIASQNYADYISVPNKGYGFGNNRGCEYALQHYDFKYLIISNADIQIEALSIETLEKHRDAIMAPKILNLSGKNQNPSSPFTPGRLLEWMKYRLYQGHHDKLIYAVFAYSRLTKILYYTICRFKHRIFSAHGAFVIFPRHIAEALYPFYHEEMFLFNEEEHLGRLAKMKGVHTIYAPEIVVRHQEDGSMKMASVNEFERMRQSFMVYYNYWNQK